MPIVFSHISALELSRANCAPFLRRSPVPRSFSLPRNVSQPLPLIGTGSPEAALSEPYHVLVEQEKRRRKTPRLAVHSVAGAALPNASILRVGEGYACSPELFFSQIASLVQRIELVRLGFELCGTYALSRAHPQGFYARDPLTSTARLQAYLDKIPGLRGTKPARWALPYILPRSASPRETVVAMLFELPCVHGGRGLGKPSLNHQVIVTRSINGVRQKRTYRIDMYWPGAKLGLEYDSDAEHTGPDRIAQDAQRRNDLESTGITMLTITNKQVKSLWEFNKLAHIVAGRLGRQMQPRCKDYAARQRALHALLLRDGL